MWSLAMNELIANLAPPVGGMLLAIGGYFYAKSLGRKSAKVRPAPAAAEEPYLPMNGLGPKIWGGVTATVRKERRGEAPAQRITH
jgi:hypothetical protein